MKVKLISSLLVSALAAGCAMPVLNQDGASSETGRRLDKAIEDFATNKDRPLGVVREIAEPRANAFTRTETTRIRGDVNVTAAAAPFGPILAELAKAEGYSVAFGEGVDVMRKVSVSFSDALSIEAIRTTAFLAGYAAVVDKERRQVMVAETATYAFRLPSAVFSALKASYKVGGNPANSSSGGSEGSSGTSLVADFTISGADENKNSSLQKFLQDFAGPSSQVLVSETGSVSVRGNAQALRRVHDFMRSFALDAMTQVEMEASVVEVGLSNDFQLGIQWQRVLDGKAFGLGNPATNAGSLLASGASAPIGAYRTSQSSTSIIQALAKFTDVKVISQPRLVSLNNSPATFFDGSQLPYVPKTEQSAVTTGTGGVSSTVLTGQVAFAIDGVSFSAVPSVVDANSVQITLVPVLSTVKGYKTFLNNTLEAPLQSNKQTYMRVLAESGKTLILGGIRYSVDNAETSVGATTGSQTSSKEVVILLRANVIPAPAFDPLASESL